MPEIPNEAVEALRSSLWSTWGKGRQTTDWPGRHQLKQALEAAAPFLVAQEREAREKAEQQVEDWKRRYRRHADEVSRRGRRLDAAAARITELEAERLTPNQARLLQRCLPVPLVDEYVEVSAVLRHFAQAE